MGRTRDGTVEWNWGDVPKLLVESLSYPVRAGGSLGLLKAVLVGGLLISPFLFLLFGYGREDIGIAWQDAVQSGGPRPTFLILLIAVAVLLATIPFGYLLRVVQHASADGQLPSFGNPKRLAILGAQMATVYFFYLFFPREILESLIGSMLPGLQIPDLGVQILFIIFLYLYPAAVARFAEEERLLSAIPQRIHSLLWSRTYAVGAVGSGLIGGAIYVIRRQLTPDNAELILLPAALIAFYLFVAQHYVIGQTWRAITAEKSASEPLETPSEEPRPNDRTDTGELRGKEVLSTEDAAVIRGRFESAMREPDPDTGELLEALRTLHERGVLSGEEYEENRREITAGTGRTGPETGSTDTGPEEPGADSERTTTSRNETTEKGSVASEARTGSTEGEAGVEAAPDPNVGPTGFDRNPTPTDETGTTSDVDDAEDASERHERFAILRQLYGQDALPDREFEAERRELGPDGREGIPEDVEEDLAERLETVRDLYEWGLLTREEYTEKRRALLEDSE